jgi:hypothetical protein
MFLLVRRFLSQLPTVIDVVDTVNIENRLVDGRCFVAELLDELDRIRAALIN